MTVVSVLRGSCEVAIALHNALSPVRNEGLDSDTKSKKGLRGGGCFSELEVRVLSKSCNFGAQFKKIKSFDFVGERL